VLANGHVECWGDNHEGQLGNGTTTEKFGRSDVPVEVTGISTATQVSAGGRSSHSTCALLADGHAECWGNNERGQLGTGNHHGSDVPVEVTGISAATQLAVGDNPFTCAVLSSGHAHCWGENAPEITNYAWDMGRVLSGGGELGNGTTTNSDFPVEVTGMSAATQVSAGGRYTCAVLSSGHAECWGDNGGEALGNGGWHDDLVSSPLAAQR
jgi:alpha-tubulin suppressor-like RCC1 family protein